MRGLLRKKLVALILCVTIVAPSLGGFATPKKADAFLFSAVVEVGANLFQNTATAISSVTTAAMQVGLNIKEYVLDPLAWLLVKRIIQGVLNSTLNWINNGFQGKPAFVTNPEQFFYNVGSMVVGDFIQNDPNLNFLCSPFQSGIRAAVRTKYYNGFDQNVRCTLDSVVGNIDGFVNDFERGGWRGWFAMTQNDQNNPFGAYLMVQSEMLDRVNNIKALENRKLGWGRGFLTFEDANGNSRTPGSIIQDRLNDELGTGGRSLEIADEIDEMLGALIQQLIGRVLGGSGLRNVGNVDDGGASLRSQQQLQATPIPQFVPATNNMQTTTQQATDPTTGAPLFDEYGNPVMESVTSVTGVNPGTMPSFGALQGSLLNGTGGTAGTGGTGGAYTGGGGTTYVPPTPTPGGTYTGGTCTGTTCTNGNYTTPTGTVFTGGTYTGGSCTGTSCSGGSYTGGTCVANCGTPGGSTGTGWTGTGGTGTGGTGTGGTTCTNQGGLSSGSCGANYSCNATNCFFGGGVYLVGSDSGSTPAYGTGNQLIGGMCMPYTQTVTLGQAASLYVNPNWLGYGHSFQWWAPTGNPSGPVYMPNNTFSTTFPSLGVYRINIGNGSAVMSCEVRVVASSGTTGGTTGGTGSGVIADQTPTGVAHTENCIAGTVGAGGSGTCQAYINNVPTIVTYCTGTETSGPCRPTRIDMQRAEQLAVQAETEGRARGYTIDCTPQTNGFPGIDRNTALNYFIGTNCTINGQSGFGADLLVTGSGWSIAAVELANTSGTGSTGEQTYSPPGTSCNSSMTGERFVGCSGSGCNQPGIITGPSGFMGYWLSFNASDYTCGACQTTGTQSCNTSSAGNEVRNCTVTYSQGTNSYCPNS